MRKTVFLFIAFFTAYMAGEFRQLWLMVLFAMEAFLFVVSFILSVYFKGKVTVELPRHSEAMEKDTWIPCRLRIRNTGRLPVSRFQVRIRYGYAGNNMIKGSGRIGESVKQDTGHTGEDVKQDTGHTGKNMKKSSGHIEKNVKKGPGYTGEKAATREIYGSCNRGESVFQFEITGRYCGIMTVGVVRLRVYDYLALFSASGKVQETVEMAVYPGGQALNLDRQFPGDWADSGFMEQTAPGSGESGSEIRQLREYRSGDSGRYIHWNQSARTGRLWVKEYEKESDARACLFLDLDGLGDGDIRKRDAFYELLSALILGLLEKVRMVRVRWYDCRRKCFEEKEVGDRGQSRELLLMLYRMYQGGSCGEMGRTGGEAMSPAETGSLEAQEAGQSFLTLDGELRLYWKGELVCGFSARHLEDQIRGRE